MDRFYKTVTTGPAMDGGFAVLLDAKPVRTPGKALMAAPTESLAKAVAAEWDAQKAAIDAQTMPLTQLLTTAIDRMQARADITEQALHYLDSDLLCYCTQEPPSLRETQDKDWTPWLRWFEKRFGAKLETTFSLVRLDQPKAAHDAVRKYVAGMDIHSFTVFQATTALTGSIVLGLALAEGAVTADQALRCALCEEMHYEQVHDLARHGLDPIEERRRKALARDLEACARYLSLSGSARS